MFLSKRVGGVYYLFYFDDLGKRHKVTTGSTLKSEALKFLQTFKQSEHERQTRQQRVLLSQFAEDYARHSSTVHTPKSQESVRTSFREFLRVVGDQPLHNVGVREIEHFVAVKKKEASERTARVYFVTLASAFETARRWNCIKVNPFRAVDKPHAPEKDPAYLTKDEFGVLLSLVHNPDLHDFYILAVTTGLRLGELTALRWVDVDLGRGVLHVRNTDTFTTKTKRNRVVPLIPVIVQLLATRKTQVTNELVFHFKGRRMTKDYVSKGFKRYLRRARLNESVHFHSLRHTFASWLVQNGASLYEVQKLLGHTTSAMTQIYAHLQPEAMHETVNRIGFLGCG